MARILAVVGSPRKDGLSSALSDSVLAGAAEAGLEAQKVFLSDYDLQPCHDCTELGCYREGKCNYEDEFEIISGMMDSSDALVVATPVYWGDVSNATRWLFNKKMRMRSDVTNGQPALPIAVAGGSGNGLAEALKPLYLFFEKLRYRTLGAFPVTRYNLDECHRDARSAGLGLAQMSKRPRIFDLVELFAWNNDLPYRNCDRIDERLLLAQLIVRGIRELKDPAVEELAGKLSQSEAFVDSGDKNSAVPLINEICDRGQAFFDRHHDGR